VFARLPGSERLFTVACLVVLLSVVLHGTGMALFLGDAARSERVKSNDRPAPATGGVSDAGPAAEPIAPPVAEQAPSPDVPERITIGEVEELNARSKPVTIIDARADRSYRADDIQAKGAVRLDPADPARSAAALRLSQHGTLVIYCA
jgi:hypothetical protein